MLPLVISVFSAGWGDATNQELWVQQSRQLVNRLQDGLKMRLGKALSESGPVAAVAVCNVAAPEIADQVSSESAAVGRTALRVRNPDNAPDKWEAAILQKFEQRVENGEDAAQIEYSEILDNGGQRRFRYMKAIPTGGLCLTCHGSDLAPELRERIAKLYPDDQATGFSAGELRGAFTVSIDIGPVSRD